MRGSILTTLAISLAGLAAPDADAADPCASDVKQFCADVKPGGGRVAKCLRENAPKLSAECREKLEADEQRLRKTIEEFGAACRSDAERFCPKVQPGGGRVIDCLTQNGARLTPPCQAEVNKFSEARDRVLAVRRACKPDVESLCEGVPPEAGPLLDCLQANKARLSPECKATDIDLAIQAGQIVDTLDELTSEARIKENLEILQGIESVAFSRSEFELQFDHFQSLGGRANADRYVFTPQFVFGERNQFAVQLRVPILTLYPTTTTIPTQSGIADVTTAFGWAFFSRRGVRQYLAFGLQWNTATHRQLGAAWAAQPTYVIAVGLQRWLFLTTEVSWLHSFGALGGYPAINVLLLRPIFTAALPSMSFVALDTKLAWDLVNSTFVPVMKGVAGRFIGKDRSVSISAWYQASLTNTAVALSFNFGVGAGLSYFFDW